MCEDWERIRLKPGVSRSVTVRALLCTVVEKSCENWIFLPTMTSVYIRGSALTDGGQGKELTYVCLTAGFPWESLPLTQVQTVQSMFGSVDQSVDGDLDYGHGDRVCICLNIWLALVPDNILVNRQFSFWIWDNSHILRGHSITRKWRWRTCGAISTRY